MNEKLHEEVSWILFKNRTGFSEYIYIKLLKI